MSSAETKHNACFVAGTLVHTDKGLVPIQNLKIGDKVLSRPENGDDTLSYQPIISTFKSQKKEKYIKSNISIKRLIKEVKVV